MMTTPTRRRLVRHGAVLMALGLLAGFPYAFVVLGQLEGSLRAWRMAHLEGVLNGLVLLAIAGIGDVVRLGARAERWLVGALLVMGYGNVIASILGASTGTRGLEPGGSVANTTVYVLFMAAIAGIAIALWLVGRSARDDEQ